MAFLLLQGKINQETKYTKCTKFNTCEFNAYKKDISELRNLSIIKYSIVNNLNKKKILLSEYFLVKNSKDTFNVITMFNLPSSDSLIKEYRWSSNWNFMSTKNNSCLDFYSQINLRSVINFKYPILFGEFYGEFD